MVGQVEMAIKKVPFLGGSKGWEVGVGTPAKFDRNGCLLQRGGAEWGGRWLGFWEMAGANLTRSERVILLFPNVRIDKSGDLMENTEVYN